MAEAKRHGGDGGETQLGAQRVRKDHLRVGCVGSIDELSSFLGLARASLLQQPADERVTAITSALVRMQRELYVLGAQMAGHALPQAVPGGIDAGHVATLDREVAELEQALPKLRAFILPGGSVSAAELHVARAICRRLERQVVRLAASEPVGAWVIPYLNRLSLVLFMMARQAAALSGIPDDPA